MWRRLFVHLGVSVLWKRNRYGFVWCVVSATGILTIFHVLAEEACLHSLNLFSLGYEIRLFFRLYSPWTLVSHLLSLRTLWVLFPSVIVFNVVCPESKVTSTNFCNIRNGGIYAILYVYTFCYWNHWTNRFFNSSIMEKWIRVMASWITKYIYDVVALASWYLVLDTSSWSATWYGDYIGM